MTEAKEVATATVRGLVLRSGCARVRVRGMAVYVELLDADELDGV